LAENVPFSLDEVRETALKTDMIAVDVLEVFRRLVAKPR